MEFSVFCAREQPSEHKKVFDNLKKTLRDYLANGKPILVLYDADLRALLDATTNDYCLKKPIDRNAQLEQVGYLIGIILVGKLGYSINMIGWTANAS